MEELCFDLNKNRQFDTEKQQVSTTLGYGDYTLNITCGKDTISGPNLLLYNMNQYQFYQVEVLKNGSPIALANDDYFKELYTLYPIFNTKNTKLQLIQPNIVTLLIYIKEGSNYVIPVADNPWVL